MKKLIFIILGIVFSVLYIFSVKLNYKYDEKIFLIYCTKLNSNYFYNGVLSGNIRTLQVTSLKTESIKNNKAKILLTSYFTDISKNKPNNKKFIEEENYEFKKDIHGKIYGDKDNKGIYDFPVFPDYDLSPGDSWDDLSYFDINVLNEDDYEIILKAEMHYQLIEIKKVKYDGKETNVAVINADAVIVYDKLQKILNYSNLNKLAGNLKFIIEFDIDSGIMYSINESFEYFILMNDNSVIESTGNSETKYQISKVFSEIEIINIEDELKDDNINVELHPDNSISITIGQLQFQADTARLLEGESSKLDNIALILFKNYRFNKILIRGYTADFGKAVNQKQLSEDRAKSVADYFIEKYNFDKNLISYEGLGNLNPIADNSTEEGKAKNRRVEIIIFPR